MSSAPSTSDTTTGDPSSGQQPTQKQQGGDRPTEEPSDPASTQAVASSKNEAEAAQSSDQPSESSAAKAMAGEGKQPQDEDERQEMAQKGELPKIPGDHSGEPMKMHGATEGATDESADKEGKGSAKTDRSKSVAQEGGGEHGKEQGTLTFGRPGAVLWAQRRIGRRVLSVREPDMLVEGRRRGGTARLAAIEGGSDDFVVEMVNG
jgi:hypothetical protein